MSVRLRPSCIIETTINDLPFDILSLIFVQLNPVDLLMAEQVCKIWEKVSKSQNEIWKLIAYRKGIFVDCSLPIRAKVIKSFRPYCEAARKIFLDEFKFIPLHLPPIIEKQRIDQRISEIDKSMLNPLKTLSESLKIEGSPYKPIEAGRISITDCIHMIPVLVETGKLNITEDLFHHLMNEEGHLEKFTKNLVYYNSLVEVCIQSLLIDGRPRMQITFANTISNILDMQKAIFSVAEYILHFTPKPTLKIVADLCFESAGIQFRQAWHSISLKRHEKKDILTPLLENLKNDHWDHAFEQFILKEGLNVNTEIDYPPFIQKILKQMDKTEVQELIDSIPPPPIYTNNVYTSYMQKQRHKDLQRSILKLTR